MELSHEKGGKALYVQIKDIYRDKILSGELQNGDRIESESEIQKLFGVSRITARQAILDLEKEGMVNRGRGKGTFVTWSPAEPEDIDSLNHAIQYYGARQGKCSYDMETGRIPAAMAQLFSLPTSLKMYCFTRLQESSSMNLFYAETYFPLEFELPENREASELFAIAENKRKQGQKQVIEEFSAQVPNAKVRRALEVSEDVPVLARKRVVLDEKGHGLEYTIAWYRGDVCSFLHNY